MAAVNVGLVVWMVLQLMVLGLQILFVFTVKAGRGWAPVVPSAQPPRVPVGRCSG